MNTTIVPSRTEVEKPVVVKTAGSKSLVLKRPPDFKKFLEIRKAELIKMVGEHIPDNALEFAEADYEKGNCLGEPVRLWRRSGNVHIEDLSVSLEDIPPTLQVHFDLMRNRALLVAPGFFARGAWIVTAAGDFQPV